MSKIIYRNLEETQGIVIVTSRGEEKWNGVDYYERWGSRYFLLQSDLYGDELPYIIINDLGVIQEWNWYGLLEEWINITY